MDLVNVPSGTPTPGQTRFSTDAPPTAATEVVLHTREAPQHRLATLTDAERTAMAGVWDMERVVAFARTTVGGSGGPTQRPRPKLALQFPDALVGDAPLVATMVAEALGGAVPPIAADVVVLADSAYSGCCVDEVAAEHVNAAAIVHYGPACLTATARLPVLYVFCAPPLPAPVVPPLAHAILPLLPATTANVIVCYELAASRVAAALAPLLAADSRNVVLMAADAEDAADAPAGALDAPGDGDAAAAYTYAMGGFSFALDAPLAPERDVFVFVTLEPDAASPLLTALQLNHPGFVFVEGVAGPTPDAVSAAVCRGATSRALMKRYMMMEKVKSAEVIGLLVGTLAVGPYLEMLDELRALIEAAGRSYYTFVVGKVNVPKLANFMEVDVFVVVSCPLTALIDSRDYIKPMVTPFEAFLALTPGAEWTGEYSTDFSHTLARIEAADPPASLAAHTDADDEHIVTSLSSGSGRSSIRAFALRPKLAPSGSHDPTAAASSSSSSSALVSRSDAKRQLAVSDSSSGAAAVLAARSWRGIQVDDHDGADPPPPALIAPGRSGRAARYDGEGARDSSGE